MAASRSNSSDEVKSSLQSQQSQYYAPSQPKPKAGPNRSVELPLFGWI